MTDELTFTIRQGEVTKCTITIPAQEGLKGITYTNKAAGAIKDITVDIGLTSLAYFQKEGAGVGKCPTLAKATGKYTAHPTVTGTDKGGKAVSFWIE